MGKYYITPDTSGDVDPSIYYTKEQAEADHLGAGGNRDYPTFNNEMYQRFCDAFNDLNTDSKDILSDECSKSSSEADVVIALINLVRKYFEKADRSKLANSEILTLGRLRDEFRKAYSDSPDEHMVIQKTCEIIYGKPFIYDTLTGYSQGDWLCAIYPQELSDKIPFIEAVLFNTGTEFYLCLDPLDTPPTQDDWLYELDMITGYTNLSSDNEAELKKGAADIIGCTADEVELIIY